MKKIFFIVSVLLLAVINIPQIHAQATLREKIGQMIWVGFSGTKLSDTIKVDLKKRNLGGVILFAGNISSANQVKLLNDTIRFYSKTAPFIAVDQEGGRVARLNSTNGFKSSYSAYTLGTVFNREDSTRKAAALMASWLKQCGFNVNLAPVADVNVNPISPAIGKLDRSFSSYPATVFQHCSWFIDEFNKNKILACLKHFPGHGSALQDSHLGFTDITNTWTNAELIPYQSLISLGYRDLVMTGHIYNAKLDIGFPASLSKNVTTEILRNQLGFAGLAITDDMANMQAITLNYAFEDAVEHAVNAGNDILLYINMLRNGTSMAGNLIDIIEGKVKQGKISENRITDSYNRIINAKARYGIITSAEKIAVEEIPSGFVLNQNYPNPFNPATTISYTLPVNSFVSLKVFDTLGKVVSVLVDSEKPAGSHSVIFNGSRLSSGIYFYQLSAGGYSFTKKLMLVK